MKAKQQRTWVTKQIVNFPPLKYSQLTAKLTNDLTSPNKLVTTGEWSPKKSHLEVKTKLLTHVNLTKLSKRSFLNDPYERYSS